MGMVCHRATHSLSGILLSTARFTCIDTFIWTIASGKCWLVWLCLRWQHWCLSHGKWRIDSNGISVKLTRKLNQNLSRISHFESGHCWISGRHRIWICVVWLCQFTAPNKLYQPDLGYLGCSQVVSTRYEQCGECGSLGLWAVGSAAEKEAKLDVNVKPYILLFHLLTIIS